MARARRIRWWWLAVAVGVIVLIFVAVLVVPILTHNDQGLSGQEAVEDFPLTVTATGDDGRTRTLMVHAVEAGGVVDTSAVTAGERIVVTGSGYDASRGIYVAICRIPDDPATKPGPCLGGVPDQEQQEIAEGTVQFAPSNWINDDWAWRLFGARGFDDVATGTFTAYLEVPAPVGDDLDCRSEACGIFTRNDHTALNDRVQDLHLPIAFAG